MKINESHTQKCFNSRVEKGKEIVGGASTKKFPSTEYPITCAFLDKKHKEKHFPLLIGSLQAPIIVVR
jgi:hypothetical protein